MHFKGVRDIGIVVGIVHDLILMNFEVLCPQIALVGTIIGLVIIFWSRAVYVFVDC